MVARFWHMQGRIALPQGKGKTMSLVINHNMMAANVARNLNIHYGNLATSTQRLSTGMRINSAADDAAGLAIRELQRSDIAVLMQGARNANDAVSLIQVADGAISIIDEKLIRMRELAEQAATGTYSSTQRMLIDSEYQQMASEITRIANATDFNGTKLLDGSLSGAHDGSQMNPTGALKIHFGTGNDSAEDYYYIQIGDCTAAGLGVGNTAFEFVEPRITELTTEYYEELRDASAEKTYQSTYTEKYASFYQEIYTKLTTGTPPHEGLPAKEASEQAAEEARRLADEYASQDRDMVKAVMDKIYEDAFQPAYERAYKAAVSGGMTHEEADSAASKTATEDAIQAVFENSEAALNADSLEGLTANAVVERVESEAYDAVYQKVYASLYKDAELKAKNALGSASLTVTQAASLRQGVEAAADDVASRIAAGLKDSIFAVYGADGDPDKMAAAIEAALASGTAFGTFSENDLLTTVDIELQKSPTETVTITAQNSATAQDVTDIYKEVGAGTKPTLQLMPPRNREGADAFINHIGSQAYDAVYNQVYNNLYPSAITAAENRLGITTPDDKLRAEQILAIHNAVREQATTLAEKLRTQVEEGMEYVYSNAYAGDGTTTGFDVYYQEALKSYPEEVARHIAETKASDDGWTAMIKAAENAANAGTPFGFPLGANKTNEELEARDFNIARLRIDVPLVDDVTQTTQIRVGAYTGQAGDVTAVYKAIGTGAQTYMDNYGILGNPDGVIDAAEYYATTFKTDTVGAWLPSGGNNVLTQENAQKAVVAIADAIARKDEIRAHLGALQNRFENTITNLNIQAENLQQAESRISDVDVATEMTEFVRQQILSQSAIAMLAQANALPQMAMQLISG